MKKTIKNRDIFERFIILTLVIGFLIAIMIGFVACNKKDYNTSAYTIEFLQKDATFTIPKDAELRVDKKIKNFVFEEVAPKKKKNIGNLVQYVFDNDINQTFRIEKQGYITRAGYFGQQGNFEILLATKENVCERNQYESTLPLGMAGIDDIMLTNVGDDYFKVLQLEEKFDLRLFRNTMIVDNYSSNTEIEPDFEAEIICGDSVSIAQSKENMFEICAQKQGVTKIKFSYQAIEVLNGDNLFCYNASDKRREAVITFAVGEHYTTDIDIKVNGRDFDSEFDTFYFDGECGELQLEVEGGGSVLCNDILVSEQNGTYPIEIAQGANYIEVQQGGKSTFLTIFGAKIAVNVQSDLGRLSVGDKIKINVQGVYTAIPKLSGVYNPTQNHSIGNTPTNGSRLKLVMANGDNVFAEYKSQYYSGANCFIEFEAKPEYIVNGKLTFDINFYYEWWGEELGYHRNITASGVDSNLDAVCHSKILGFYPTITI